MKQTMIFMSLSCLSVLMNFGAQGPVLPAGGVQGPADQDPYELLRVIKDHVPAPTYEAVKDHLDEAVACRDSRKELEKIRDALLVDNPERGQLGEDIEKLRIAGEEELTKIKNMLGLEEPKALRTLFFMLSSSALY